MDKPSCVMAIVGAAAASVVFGGAMGPMAAPAETLPPVPAATVSSAPMAGGCARAPLQQSQRSRDRVPSVVPPAGPSDAQVNASGTSAAGGAGTVPGDARGDPCEPAKRFGETRGAASAAAGVTTPTSLDRR
jgi:hypothetical protein